MQSIDTGYRYIREGVSDLILAGGAEALSHAPLVWPQQGVRWFAGLAGARGIGAKIMAALKIRPSYLKPIIGLERGLTDPLPNSIWDRPPRWSGISSASTAPSPMPMPPKATSDWRMRKAKAG